MLFSNFFLTIYWYLPFWELFPTLQTSKSFHLITTFSLKQPDQEMILFSLYCRIDFQESHVPWWQASQPVCFTLRFTVSGSLLSHQNCNVHPQCKTLTTSGQQGSYRRVIHFSSNIGFTSFSGKGALLPELDELYLKIMLGRVCNFDCTYITLYLRWFRKMT